MRWAVALATAGALVASASASASLPSNDSSFSFDGTTSDLAQQLYLRYLAGEEVDQIDISDGAVPASIASRLSDAGINAFSSLPGLVQRALLWDTGFAIASDGSLRQIWPLDERSMADLAVPMDDFLSAGCTTLKCAQPDGVIAYSNQFCSGTQMLTVARCVAEDYDKATDKSLAMWATGGSSDTIPELRLIKHEWTVSDEAFLVYAIHTMAEDAEPKYNTCPDGGYGSIVIPCHPLGTYNESSSLKAPPATAWIDEWLQELSNSTADSTGSLESGSTVSDIARQLYEQYQANVSVPAFNIDKVPERVLQRLDDLDVTFENIHPIAQRALLWDTGYAITSDGQVKEVWVLPDRLGGDDPTMASLVVSREEFNDVGCVELNCTQPDDTLAYASLYCNGVQMLNAVKCAIEDFDDGGKAHMAMWTTGGDMSTSVPEIRAVMHQWEDANKSYLVYAIHTMAERIESAYGSWCPAQNNGYGSLTLPCYPLGKLTGQLDASKAEPTQSEWLNEWMQTFQTAEQRNASNGSGSGLSLYVWIAIGGGALLLILIGVCFACIFYRQRHKASRDKLDSPVDNNDFGGFRPVGEPQNNQYQMYNQIATPQFSRDVDSERRTASMSEIASQQQVLADSSRTSGATGSLNGSSSGVLCVLRDDPNLTDKRIPFESISFKRLLAKGAFGEVWACVYTSVGHPEEVAVKRLLQDRTHKYEAIQEFTSEIQLSASLSHPNIVEFLGVAWTMPQNLLLVMELLPMGDLQNYLRKQGDLLSWGRDKIHVAIGIARALEYLHSREPPLIHRDMKSRNVLLTRDLFPKIIDFGVTRRRAEETMTAGIGTPYWTAPEVLSGQRYTEQSDIYSFGVLLSEMDTCRLPYHDAAGPNGAQLKPFQVLDGVISGVLRPSFRHDCPGRVRQVGIACMQHDPSRRPSAKKLVEILGG